MTITLDTATSTETRSENATYLARLREDALAKGLCFECRARPRKSDDVKRCQVCLDNAYKRRRVERKKNRKQRRCSCGRERARGKTQCTRCRTRHQVSEQRRRDRLGAVGRCGKCGGPQDVADRKHCAACLRALAEARARWYRREVQVEPEVRHCTICRDTRHNARGHEAAAATARELELDVSTPSRRSA